MSRVTEIEIWYSLHGTLRLNHFRGIEVLALSLSGPYVPDEHAPRLEDMVQALDWLETRLADGKKIRQ
jgi:protein-tyrosine phosphatase